MKKSNDHNSPEKEYSEEEIKQGLREYFSMLGSVATTLAISPYIFPTFLRSTTEGVTPDSIDDAVSNPSKRLTTPEENGGNIGIILGGLALLSQFVYFASSATGAIESRMPDSLRYLATTNSLSLGYEVCRGLYRKINPEGLSNHKGIFQKAGHYLFGYPNSIIDDEEKKQKLKKKYPELEDLL